MQNELTKALERAARDTGAELRQSAAAVALYTTQRAAHLAAIAGQPGFDEAIIAEEHNVATYAGIAAVQSADAADQRVFGIIQGALAIAARAAAGV